MILTVCACAFTLQAQEQPTSNGAERWTPERAWQWYNKQPWLCGFNYVPANDISYTEMWMDYGFDSKVIDRELALAQNTGFNCLRVVLSYVVWKGDRDGFLKRYDDFLAICARHNLRVITCFFDDCCFGPITEPIYGPQPKVVPGWYSNGWTPSPGHETSVNLKTFPELQRFVQDVMSAHRNDPRVLCWDLYNESGNAHMGDKTLPLLQAVFQWARTINPTQPITSCDYSAKNAQCLFVLAHSDVITFHCYAKPARLQAVIDREKKEGRPIICTEWLNRNTGSTIADCLPVFAKAKIGCLSWGLVNGKTQTNLNSGHRPGQPLPPRWQHDLYRGDLTPYDPNELSLFRETIQRMNSVTKQP